MTAKKRHNSITLEEASQWLSEFLPHLTIINWNEDGNVSRFFDSEEKREFFSVFNRIRNTHKTTGQTKFGMRKTAQEELDEEKRIIEEHSYLFQAPKKSIEEINKLNDERIAASEAKKKEIQDQKDEKMRKYLMDQFCLQKYGRTWDAQRKYIAILDAAIDRAWTEQKRNNRKNRNRGNKK